MQWLNKAVEIGHRISQVASLSHEELSGIVRSDVFHTRHHNIEEEEESLCADTFIGKSLQSITKLDGNGLQAILDEAAVNLTRPTVILDVILPLYMKTKRFVRTGKLRVINLSLATSMLRSFLWDMLRTTVVSESAPKVVIVTFTDERSDIEALVLALTGVESGWRSIYFGPNLPVRDVVAAVKSNRTRALALSISHSNDESITESEIKKLRDELDNDIDLLICANGNSSLDYLANIDGISVTKLKNFRRKLESLTTAELT